MNNIMKHVNNIMQLTQYAIHEKIKRALMKKEWSAEEIKMDKTNQKKI
jgi:hypothetical protein